jgi:iron complex outermembrane recepter protein
MTPTDKKRKEFVKRKTLPIAISALFALSTQAIAQTPQNIERIEVTGSSIKRVQSEGALPVQIITAAELSRSGITTVEQLLEQVSVNGNGFDNLASNGDVAAGAQRGNSGLSAANLRGQGANATLVLLNGRRVAAHGLSGGVVDLNQIPIAAIERIEILKDGASAIYGTDAIGGVMNFILRRDFKGISVNGNVDITEQGGANVYRASVLGGWGDLNRDGFNVMGSLSYSKSDALFGKDRGFVNTFQPNRGLSVDTRGTPFATAFTLTTQRTILTSRNAAGALVNGTGPTQPTTTQAMNGINALDITGQPGCESIDGQSAYDEKLWATPAAKWGCAWDTGRAAAIQQPVDNLSGMVRGVFKVNNNITLFGEFVGANVVTRKTFSPNQISSSAVSTNPFFNLVYPSTGVGYNYVFNSIVSLFPTIEENRGQGIAFRWRCMPCGPREIETESDTKRVVVGAEGAFGTFDYKAGFSQATSDTKALLAGGYYFNDKFVPLLAKGILNPFAPAGEAQTTAALEGLAAASATGTTLYGGKFTLTQADASISGPIFKMPAGDAYMAVGVDVRTEKYAFNGNATDLAVQRTIFNAPFDSVNDLNGIKRDIRAVYGEVLVPVAKSLELTAAVRHDNYTGFGGTTNPKISFRFAPAAEALFRGSYSTGFRVPTFNQQFFGVTLSPYSGKDLVDPTKCVALVVSTAAGCESITPTILTGGKPELQPEKAKSFTLGLVVAPAPWFSANIDYFDIRRTGSIQSLSLSTIISNAALFPEAFVRDASGSLVAIDNRWLNAGETITKGVEIGAKFQGNLWAGRFNASIDAAQILERKSRLIASAPFGPNEVGEFSRSGDIPLSWKHTARFTYTQGAWSGTITNIYAAGYKDAVLPGVANGTVVPPDWSQDVSAWSTFNLSATYTGIKNFAVSFGIKNILNSDPPFSSAYDGNTGAGSSWEPRIADPRGRAYWASVGYNF